MKVLFLRGNIGRLRVEKMQHQVYHEGMKPKIEQFKQRIIENNHWAV